MSDLHTREEATQGRLLTLGRKLDIENHSKCRAVSIAAVKTRHFRFILSLKFIFIPRKMKPSVYNFVPIIKDRGRLIGKTNFLSAATFQNLYVVLDLLEGPHVHFYMDI